MIAKSSPSTCKDPVLLKVRQTRVALANDVATPTSKFPLDLQPRQLPPAQLAQLSTTKTNNLEKETPRKHPHSPIPKESSYPF